MAERECWPGDKHTVEQRYFLNSIAPHAPTLARAVREHWAIENSLPWRLDVICGDDACRIRTKNGPAIMTSIKQLCLNLFEPENSPISPPKNRRRAAWDDNYRAKVLFL